MNESKIKKKKTSKIAISFFSFKDNDKRFEYNGRLEL